MKIAATYDNGNIFQHFGKTEFFKVYEVEDNKVVSSEVIGSNGTGHGALAGLLAEQGISVLICGGIGGGAQSALAEAGIELCSGAQGDADAAVEAYLKGELVSTGVNCDHHHEEGHSCGSHEDGHSCGGHEEGHSCGNCGGGCGSQPAITGPNVGKTCRTHYRGTFNDGTQFDSSYDRGEPLEFICGAGQMIKGFDAAVANMEVGQVVDVHLMPEEAYGMPNPDADQSVEESFLDKETEFALELNNTSLYEEYLRQLLKDFLASYWQKNYLTHSWLAGRTPERFYIGNQFCHNLFPTEEQLFSIMDKMRSEGLEITLAFSYIREFMLPSVGKLLEKVDNWCCIHGMNVEIVVNDWAVAEMLHGKTSHLCPVFGTLLNKRKKDPRMKYKSGDISLFQQNSLNAEFYRDFLAEEFHIHRYEWESCGYPQEFPPGKNSLHLPFYQTNTSQYCPLYALCTTGDRGTQQLAEHCPKFCEKYALLYPEHLHMMGRYNSLFGVDKTFLESPEMWKKIKGIKPDRIVVNL